MATRRALESASHAMQLPTVSAKPSRRVVGPGAEITCPLSFTTLRTQCQLLMKAGERRRTMMMNGFSFGSFFWPIAF